MLNYTEREVHIKARPVQMFIVPQLHFTDLLDIRFFEPGKMLKRQKILLAFEIYPEAML
jgi:hypothetical protein